MTIRPASADLIPQAPRHRTASLLGWAVAATQKAVWRLRDRFALPPQLRGKFMSETSVRPSPIEFEARAPAAADSALVLRCGSVAASDETLAALLDQSLDCIKLISVAGNVEYMNANGRCAMEIDDPGSVSGRPWLDLWPDEAKPLVRRALEEAAAGIAVRFDAFCPTAKGSARWWDVSLSQVRDRGGRLLGYLSVSRDVTEARIAKEVAEITASEMRHRLSNSYAMTGALLSAFARGSPEREQFATEMRDRLSSLGAAQSLFVGRDEAPLMLHELLPAILVAYSTPICSVTLGSLPKVQIDQRQADALAIVLGELAVNSSKHGALSVDGQILVTAELDGRTLTLRWQERSSRAVGGHERSGGQGLRLMQRILSARGGTMSISWKDDGLDADLRLSVPAA